MSAAVAQALAYACAVLVAIVIGLSLRLWWVSDVAADAKLARDQVQRNHDECIVANVGWEGSVDTLQTALHACTRERDAVRDQGVAAVDQARATAARLSHELASWRTRSAAAEALPACRAVLDLELCPELADY